jgi:hypothetical protein
MKVVEAGPTIMCVRRPAVHVALPADDATEGGADDDSREDLQGHRHV